MSSKKVSESSKATERQPTNSPEVGDKPISAKRDLFLALLGIAFASIIAAFDATIISTILPQVAQALDGMSLYAWVGTGYFLASSVSILIFGRLGDLYGRKPLLLLSLVLVSLGSALSGLAQSMEQLILFRVLQGVGGGMMVATAFAAPADLFPDPKERVRWMVVLSSTFAMASGVGPVLGGAITQNFGWRAAFFLIPLIGCISMIVIWKFFPMIKPHPNRRFKLDWWGGALLIVTVATPLLGLEFLTAEHITVSRWVGVMLIVTAIVGGVVLIKVERHAQTPIFPLRVLNTTQARFLNVSALLAGAVMFILVYYIPLQSQDVFGFSPTLAGLLVSPLVAGIPVGSIINGRLFPREANPQRLMMLGSILLGVGCALALTFSKDDAVWYMLTVMGLCGLGLGFLLPNFTLFMQIVCARNDIGMGSALIQTMRALGSAIGTAAVGSLIVRFSINTGLQIGLVACVAMCAAIWWLSTRIRMESFTR